MRVSPGRTGGFKSCAAQSGRLESLTRPQSFGHLKVADRATAFPRANPQSPQPSVGPPAGQSAERIDPRSRLRRLLLSVNDPAKISAGE